MQKRALIEPRQPVAWVTIDITCNTTDEATHSARRKYKRKDYETPAFRFWEKR